MKSQKTIWASLLTLILIFGVTFTLSQCTKENTGTQKDPEDSEGINSVDNRPINITVFLDLSDRLTRDLTPPQIERDVAIIKYLGDYFVNESIKNKGLLRSQNCFQILFYPTPNSSEINTHAQKLRVNLPDLKAQDKRKTLKSFQDDLTSTTEAIYQEVLKSQNWTGCDIWRFFSDKKVDRQCVKAGYRNILIILTDGYLFAEDDKLQHEHAYSYISKQTLKDPNSSLIVKRNGLDNLEVLMLEVNPYETPDINKMKEVLETWFKAMGVSKFVVADTDIPENIKIIIKDFLSQG